MDASRVFRAGDVSGLLCDSDTESAKEANRYEEIKGLQKQLSKLRARLKRAEADKEILAEALRPLANHPCECDHCDDCSLATLAGDALFRAHARWEGK